MKDHSFTILRVKGRILTVLTVLICVVYDSSIKSIVISGGELYHLMWDPQKLFWFYWNIKTLFIDYPNCLQIRLTLEIYQTNISILQFVYPHNWYSAIKHYSFRITVLWRCLIYMMAFRFFRSSNTHQHPIKMNIPHAKFLPFCSISQMPIIR